MGAKRIQPGAMSKRARRRRNTQAAKQRKAMGISLGQQLKRAGVKSGRKAIPRAQIANEANYSAVMHGMGYRVRVVPLRNPK